MRGRNEKKENKQTATNPDKCVLLSIQRHYCAESSHHVQIDATDML